MGLLTSREGLTFDVVSNLLSNTVLHPVFTTTLAALVAKNPPQLHPITDYLATLCPSYRLGLYATAGAGLAIWASNTLSNCAINNWTADPTWDFNKEIVLVTGGSGGIGASIIAHLLAKNPKTIIVVVDYVALKWSPPEGSRVHYFQCDLSNADNLREVCNRIKKEVGNPTVLVNNAGLMRGHTLMEGSYNDTALTIRTNLTAPFFLIKEFLPDMVAQNHGHIVNVSSMSALMPIPGLSDYAASKAGIAAMADALRQELNIVHKAPRVRVSVAKFSFVRTALIKGEMGTNQFLFPFLHVDSVGEKLANVVTSGYGQMVYAPETMKPVAFFAGMGPEWLRHGLIVFTSHVSKITFTEQSAKIDAKTGYLTKAD